MGLLLVSAGPSIFPGGRTGLQNGVTRRASSAFPVFGIGRNLGDQRGLDAPDDRLGLLDRTGPMRGVVPDRQADARQKADIALDAEAERQADARQFGQAETAKLGAAE